MVRRIAVLLSTLLAAALSSAAQPSILPLDSGRFELSATWKLPDGTTGTARALPLGDASGTFWFFAPTNVELVVKLLDACGTPRPRFWFFAAGLTNVEVEVRVRDTWSDETRTYRSPAGRPFPPVQDTGAFATCDAARACGQGIAEDVAATPRADRELEHLALVMEGGVAASQSAYERVVGEVSAIRAQHPALAGTEYIPHHRPDSLLMTFDPPTFAAIEAGTYHGWDCLNAWYGATPNVLHVKVVILDFDGVFETARLAADYAELPGATSVELDDVAFFGPPLPSLLCGLREGEAHLYFFDQRAADGAIWHFRSAGPGAAPQLVQVFDPRSAAPLLPAWYPLYQRCLAEYTPEDL